MEIFSGAPAQVSEKSLGIFDVEFKGRIAEAFGKGLAFTMVAEFSLTIIEDPETEAGLRRACPGPNRRRISGSR